MISALPSQTKPRILSDESYIEHIMQKMKADIGGFKTLENLAIADAIDVSKSTGLDIDDSTQICNKAIDMLEEGGVVQKSFETAACLEKYREDMVQRISTGAKGVDEILHGGVEAGSITEFYGGPGSGKSQICHCLATMVPQDKSNGGISGNAIFIDTENSFRPERIRSIAEARGYDAERVLKTISVASAYTAAREEEIVKRATSRIDQDRNIKLLIVDSVISHYRAEYGGRGMLSDRQYRVNRLMHMLLRIANIYNIAVVVTNQIQSIPDAHNWDPSIEKATGGNVMSHISNYRICLTHLKGYSWIAKIVGSPYQPTRDARFIISDAGITDVTR